MAEAVDFGEEGHADTAAYLVVEAAVRSLVEEARDKRAAETFASGVGPRRRGARVPDDQPRSDREERGSGAAVGGLGKNDQGLLAPLLVERDGHGHGPEVAKDDNDPEGERAGKLPAPVTADIPHGFWEDCMGGGTSVGAVNARAGKRSDGPSVPSFWVIVRTAVSRRRENPAGWYDPPPAPSLGIEAQRQGQHLAPSLRLRYSPVLLSSVKARCHTEFVNGGPPVERELVVASGLPR
jgi:hypothetical protein